MGFMPGQGTIDAIFVVRQLQEKHLKKERNCNTLLSTWKKFSLGYRGWCQVGPEEVVGGEVVVAGSDVSVKKSQRKTP